jgi:hypothetical protein
MVKEGIKLSMFKKITLKINIANNNINKNLGVPPPKCGVALFALLGSSLPLLTHNKCANNAEQEWMLSLKKRYISKFVNIKRKTSCKYRKKIK